MGTLNLKHILVAQAIFTKFAFFTVIIQQAQIANLTLGTPYFIETDSNSLSYKFCRF